jgi:pimeloyl-ACP methyl ester carboxylesterase
MPPPPELVSEGPKMTEALRTPDERFTDLPGFDFGQNYIEGLPGFPSLRLHYLDEGPADATETFLCLHGQPTWSYLYRKMIPVFNASGHRAVAPDLYGFGRSDKPADETVYTFDFHRRTISALIEQLDLRHITLVAQDWGGLIGLTLPMEMPERFDRLLVMNTILATGDIPLSRGFVEWRAWCRNNPDMDVAALMGRACPRLTPEERAAYAAPFPDARYKAGVRRFPELVPEGPDNPGAELSSAASPSWCPRAPMTPARSCLAGRGSGWPRNGLASRSSPSARETRCSVDRRCVTCSGSCATAPNPLC